MCGRYLFFDQSNPKMYQFIQQVKKKMPADQFEKISLFEVFPSQEVINLVYNKDTKKFQAILMHWGFQGFEKGKSIINARSETADVSPFFNPMHRCIIPCCGYYEWSRSPHQKYYFSSDNPPFYLAGLAAEENHQICFVILTEEARLPEKQIHDRQPVIFDSMHAKMWLLNKPYKRMLQASLQNRTMSKA